MPDTSRLRPDRRRFFGTTTGSIAALASVAHAGSPATDRLRERPTDDPRPAVTDPRATSGDRRYGPKRDDQFTLTVGNDKTDLCGRDERVIQAASDVKVVFAIFVSPFCLTRLVSTFGNR